MKSVHVRDQTQFGPRGVPPFAARGFTLLELLIVVAIVGTLSFAIPTFIVFYEQQQITSDSNEFTLAVAYARSESARRSGTVTVQARASQGGDNEFGGGWCVVVGNPGNCNGEVLRVAEAPNTRFDATGDLDSVLALSFDRDGLLANGLTSTADILVCPESGRGRRISISAIGRTRISDGTVAELGCEAE